LNTFRRVTKLWDTIALGIRSAKTGGRTIADLRKSKEETLATLLFRDFRKVEEVSSSNVIADEIFGNCDMIIIRRKTSLSS